MMTPTEVPPARFQHNWLINWSVTDRWGREFQVCIPGTHRYWMASFLPWGSYGSAQGSAGSSPASLQPGRPASACRSRSWWPPGMIDCYCNGCCAVVDRMTPYPEVMGLNTFLHSIPSLLSMFLSRCLWWYVRTRLNGYLAVLPWGKEAK